MHNSYTITDPQPVPRRRWRWLAVVTGAVLLLGTGVAVYAWQTGDGRKRDRALRDCREGRLAQAEPVMTDLLARHPDDAEVRSELARALTFDDRPADAIPHLNRLLDDDPNNVLLRKLRMEQHQKLKNKEDEYADARRLMELGGGDEKLGRSVVVLAFSIGKFADAEELCKTVLHDAPRDRDLRSLLSSIRRARGDDDGAATILDELIREDPRNYRALLARGILYDETGHSDLAVPLLRRVFDDDATRRRTSGYQLGMALGKLGRQAEADRVLSEVQRLQNVELFSDAIKSQPANLDLSVRLAESLLQDGHTADGLRMLEMVLAQDRGHRGAHLALAAHYEKQGQRALAAEHRRRAGQSP